MVNVTDRAKEKLKALLDTEGDDRSVGLRLGATPSGQFGVFPDRERPDDQVVEHQGAAVLLVGQEVAEKMDNTTIDYEETASGPGLFIKERLKEGEAEREAETRPNRGQAAAWSRFQKES